MKFDVHSYEGVGFLRFDMSCKEIEQSIGHIDRTVKTSDGITELYNFAFDIVAQVLTDTDRLVEIGFGHRAKNVNVAEINLFEQPRRDVLTALCSLDSAAVTGHGAILFPTLGLSLTGFENESDDMRAVTVFKKGLWDDLTPSMKPFHM